MKGQASAESCCDERLCEGMCTKIRDLVADELLWIDGGPIIARNDVTHARVDHFLDLSRDAHVHL